MSKRHVVLNGSKTTEILTASGWLVVRVESAGSEVRGIYFA